MSVSPLRRIRSRDAATYQSVVDGSPASPEAGPSPGSIRWAEGLFPNRGCWPRISDLDHGSSPCHVVLSGHGNTPYFKASRFVLSRFGKTPHFPPPGVRGLRFLERQSISPDHTFLQRSGCGFASGERVKKSRAPFRFNRNGALDGPESNRRLARYSGNSEDAGRKAGQHPRHADAEAYDGEVLLDLNCFHVVVLSPERSAFCASGHTAAAGIGR